MGMGMSISPQIWQQFVDLVFQDDLIKCKQNFDVIMDDMFIPSTAEDHMVIFRSPEGAPKIWFKDITTQVPIL